MRFSLIVDWLWRINNRICSILFWLFWIVSIIVVVGISLIIVIRVEWTVRIRFVLVGFGARINVYRIVILYLLHQPVG